MEKAILKTLIYADIFEYPLKIYEIHKWLIGKKTTLRQVEKGLEKLRVKGALRRSLPRAKSRGSGQEVKSENGYYFLARRDGLVAKRKVRMKQSTKYFRKAKMLVWILKVIPWIKLVGISGGLAMGNAKKSDDIDLFIITSKNRLWISRFFALGLLSLTGQRRKVSDLGRKIAGKLCLNILVEEDRLAQENKDIYIAHEVLQMKVLWQRNGIYGKYLEVNDWVFNLIPNWTTNLSSPLRIGVRGELRRGSNNILSGRIFNWIPAFAGMTVENLAKWLQIRIMKPPKGMERIEDGALYFHPNDIREKILKEYNKRVNILRTK